MRSSLVVVLVALAACTVQHERAREEQPAAAEVSAPPRETVAVAQTFAEPLGDALFGGLDLSDTRVLVDDEGVLVIDVEIPNARRREPEPTDIVQVYLDVDRDHDKNGYDVRLVLSDGVFGFERWEDGSWRDRTPASYEASFAEGIHIRVPADDVGIPHSFDFFVASIDAETGKVSDLSPDGALWERWSYTR